MTEDHVYFHSEGLEWKRVFTAPNASIDTRIDPNSSTEFIRKTENKKGTIGDMMDYSGYNAPGFLEYNQDDHYIYQQTIHGRAVTVAWEKEVESSESIRQSISGLYFDTFNTWWEVFLGFPFN